MARSTLSLALALTVMAEGMITPAPQLKRREDASSGNACGVDGEYDFPQPVARRLRLMSQCLVQEELVTLARSWADKPI